MWKAPKDICDSLADNIWADAAFTMRLLADAMEPGILNANLHCFCLLFMQRLHADIYDEICKKYALKYTILQDIKEEFKTDVELALKPRIVFNGLAFSLHDFGSGVPIDVFSYYHNLWQGLMNAYHTIRGKGADEDNMKLSELVLNDVKTAFEHVSLLPFDNVYTSVVTYTMRHVRPDRPYIYDTYNIRAYPTPLSLSIKKMFENSYLFPKRTLQPAQRRKIDEYFKRPTFAE